MNFLIKLKDGLVIKCKFAKLIDQEKRLELASGLFFDGNRLVPCGKFEMLVLQVDDIEQTTVL